MALTVTLVPKLYSLAQLVGQRPGASPCQTSEEVWQADVSLMGQKSPTHFNLMASRYRQIVEAARGHECAGTSAVAFDGRKYYQAGLSDDPGIAEFIPKIALLAHLSLPRSFDLTVLTVILAGSAIGYAGYWRLCPRGRRAGLAIYLLIGLLEAKIADVYIFQLSPLLAGIPWFLYYSLSSNTLMLSLCASLLAFVSSWCSLVRGGTTLISVAFMATFSILRFRPGKALGILLIVVASCIPSVLFAHRLIDQRDRFLLSRGEVAVGVNRHPIWHSIYVGLGFIPNSEVSAFKDKLGADRVRALDPTAPYTSTRYENALRSEVWRIARQKPSILIENLVAKISVVGVLALLILYPSGKSILHGRDALSTDAAFLVAILLSAAGAILVIPFPQYLLTFLGLTTLLSVVAYGRAEGVSHSTGGLHLR